MQPMDQIYQQYAREVFGFLMSRTRDRDLSEELTQETFYQAIRSVDKFDESCSVSTWLCAIAKNCFLDEKRRGSRTEPMPEEDRPDTGKGVEQTAMDRDSSFRIHMALHALEEPYREVFELRIFGELSFREIGLIFSKTENWARVTYHRARLKLQERMDAR